MKTLGVLIADDSPFVRHAVRRMIADTGLAAVIGEASNGAEAVERTRELRPDLVILDVNMPEMDGIEALRRIMAETPTAVLLLSSVTREGAAETLEALELGAVDFIDKTLAGRDMNIHALAPILQDKIRGIAEQRPLEPGDAGRPTGAGRTADEPTQPHHPAPAAARGWALRRTRAGRAPARAGRAPARAGGRAPTTWWSSGPPPEARGRSGRSCPRCRRISAPPSWWRSTCPPASRAPWPRRLASRCALALSEGCDGDVLTPGRILIAPGACQASIVADGGQLRLRVEQGEGRGLYRPSVDRLLTSAAQAAGARTVGVVLTGMGDDGAAGLRAVRDAGGRTLTESRETAVIFGMPRAAAPAAERVLPLDRIAPTLARLCAPAASGEAS